MTHIPYDPVSLASHQLWQEQISGTNRPQMERLKGKLLIAMEEVLTPRQRQIVTMYFFQGMRITLIAQELGIAKSTVSRTLRRAMERLNHTLQYSL